MNLFKKKNYIKLPASQPALSKADEPKIPDGSWIKCSHCGKPIYRKELDEYKICPNCGGHFRIGARERLKLTCDLGSFEEFDKDMTAANPIDYPDYDRLIAKAKEKSGLEEGVVTGKCTILGYRTVICVMDSNFIMGSLGSVVGEKIARAFERATAERLPIVVFAASGGARMQEGIISLMQMAKVSAAVAKHSEAGLLYISVMTDPTTGGVTASFASLGDIILAEPGAVIGFAGKRVIEQTMKKDLPKGFQTAEFQLEHGFVDKIVKRTKMKSMLGRILMIHSREAGQ